MGTPATHRVTIGNVTRELPIVEVAPGVRVALFNMLGDVEMTEACAQALAQRAPRDIDLYATAEAKSIPLAHALSRITDKPYAVFRKTRKPYMGDALHVETRSITTGTPQHLWLDEKDRNLLQGKRIALLDDVVSTGSTLHAMHTLVTAAGGTPAANLAVFTEGDPARWNHITALGHLPLY